MQARPKKAAQQGARVDGNAANDKRVIRKAASGPFPAQTAKAGFGASLGKCFCDVNANSSR